MRHEGAETGRCRIAHATAPLLDFTILRRYEMRERAELHRLLASTPVRQDCSTPGADNHAVTATGIRWQRITSIYPLNYVNIVHLHTRVEPRV